ncbi:hypothetical protein ACSYAD_26045 [Acaryochloris marina NIES-2412]|uniref:hypothetical protein n=1 Tax=Acaryochloris marina TaxID=155978 RepID=UPI0040588DC5
MTATKDETLTVVPSWSEDNSSVTPDALKAFLDTKPINRSAYISADGYLFDLEVHHRGDRFTITARMGEDTWNIYSSHKFDFSDQEESTDSWYRSDDIQMTPQHYEAVTKLIGDIGIEGPTIPTEFSGWVSQDRNEPRHLNFWFEDKGNRHYLGLDMVRHGDPDKIDKLIRDHRFDELVALATGETNAHLNYPHHANLTNLSPRQIEDFVLAEAACLAPEHDLEPQQLQNILKDMSASVLNSRGYKPDYGYQVAAGNSVEPQTNEFKAHVTRRGEWALEFNWEDDYYSIPLGGVPGDAFFQSDEDRAAVATDYGSLGEIEKMIQDSRFHELATASVSAPAHYHHYPELNDMEGVYPEVAKEMIEAHLLAVATEYGLAERGGQLLEDMRLKVMEKKGEHQNHSYDGLLGIIRVPRDELQQTLPELDVKASGVDLLPNTQEIPQPNQQPNQQPNIDLYQSLYGAADQYGDFDVGFTVLKLGKGYSATTTDHSLNIFKDDERIIRVAADSPGPYDGVLQEPFHIEDKTTSEQRDELLFELHSLEQWAKRDFEKPHQETPITEGAITLEQPENNTQQIQGLADTQVTKTPSVPIIKSTQNVFWITHEASYLKSNLTCVKTTRTHTQAKLDAYYIINEGYDHYEINDIEPLPESVCHLLIKFFGYEICEYDDSAIEIDLLYIWQGPRDPDIKVGNKSWYLWLNLSRFRWGFYPELMAIMEGRLNVNRLPQYPWNSQHKSVTGWDCGDYVIEVAFNLFNSQSEAEEFGESCYALAPYEEYCNLLKLLYIDPYGDEERTPIRKDDVQVFLRSSVFDIRSGDLRDRDEWELVSIDEWDTPSLVIGAQLYCQGRDAKAITALEVQELGEEVAVQIYNEDQSPECIQEDLENHLTVELIDGEGEPLTRQLRMTIRDVVVDVKIGFESYRGGFRSYYDADLSVVESIAQDPRFTELVAISSGMIDYPFVKYPDFSSVNCLDSGDELKRFVESRAYKLGDEYSDSSIAGKLIDEISHCHALEVDVSRYKIRNDAVKGIPFKPSKYRDGKIDQSGRLDESYVSIGEVYADNHTKNLELSIRIGSEEFTVTVGVETQNGTSYRYGDSIEPIQGITQDQRFNELVAVTTGIKEYPYTHNLDFRHPEKLTVEELPSTIEQRAKSLGEEFGVPSMGVSLIASVGTVWAVRRGTTKEGLLQSFIDPTQEAELEPVWDNPLM